MKPFKQSILLVALLMIGLTACDMGGEKSRKDRSAGGTSEILVVTQNDEQWDGIIGDTKNIKAVSIPLTFDNLNVKEATINELKDGSFPDLEIQNYFVGSKVTYAIVLTKNTGFKQVNILDKTGNIYMSDALPDNIEEIAPSCFKGMSIEKIYLPLSLIKIRSKAFMDCQSLKEIYYGHNILRQEEIKKLWEEVEKGDDWNKNVHPDFNVIFISSEGS